MSLKGEFRYRVPSYLDPTLETKYGLQHYSSRSKRFIDDQIKSSSNPDSLDITIFKQLRNFLVENNLVLKVLRDLKQQKLCKIFISPFWSGNEDLRETTLSFRERECKLFLPDSDKLSNNFFMGTDKGVEFYDLPDFHPLLDSLCFPLLFPENTLGWIPGLKCGDHKVSFREYVLYLLHQRKKSTFHIGGKVFSQFVLSCFARMEKMRLNYISSLNKRQAMRIFSVPSVESTYFNPIENDPDDPQHVNDFLYDSFINSGRYRSRCFRDSVTILRKKKANSYFFITITSNPKDELYSDFLETNQSIYDRPDIAARVFKIRINQLKHLLKNKEVLGKMCFICSAIEEQQRGSLHAHILFGSALEIYSSSDVDKVLSCQIPENETLKALVKKFMIHGPCILRPDLECRRNHHGNCKRGFPRPYLKTSELPLEGYALPCRRSPAEGGGVITYSDTKIVTESDVVCYSPVLLEHLKCHVNTELIRGPSRILKYFFKYMIKGRDMTMLKVVDNIGEIKQYITTRCVSAAFASWRLLGETVFYNYPAVYVLDVHLEPGSTLISYLDLNKKDLFARSLLYDQIPEFYVLKGSEFVRRRNKCETLGRLQWIEPNYSENYFLRFVLSRVKGANCIDDLLTVNGKRFDCFKRAAEALGFNLNDCGPYEIMDEAKEFKMPKSLRSLFVLLLCNEEIEHPRQFYDKYKQFMIGKGETETDLMKYLKKKILELDRSLQEFGLMFPDEPTVSDNVDNISRTMADFLNRADDLQIKLFKIITNSLSSVNQSLKIFSGAAGIGKSFVINGIVDWCELNGIRHITVSSTGVSASVLKGATTAHRAFGFRTRYSEEMAEQPLCSIAPNSAREARIKNCSLIIFDEIFNIDRNYLESLDLVFQEIKGVKCPFGGINMFCFGDHLQFLPVSIYTNCQNFEASILSSEIISLFKVFRLEGKHHRNTNENHRNLIGKLGNTDLYTSIGENFKVSQNLSIRNQVEEVKNLESLISSVFAPQVLLRMIRPLNTCNTVCNPYERIILVSTNDEMQTVNDLCLDRLPTEIFVSVGRDVFSEEVDDLRSLVEDYFSSCTPKLKLRLKVGAPVMLIKNLMVSEGHCNGSRYRLRHCGKSLLVLDPISVNARPLFLPRLACKDEYNGIVFKRRQFPIHLSFSATGQKMQGKGVDVIGISDNASNSNIHGFHYVCLSRSKNKIAYLNKDKTNGVVEASFNSSIINKFKAIQERF